mmetsp:Transcript_70005/g.130886  ORF Transcript_70005/g.130886 Transcript_70005/m.130886 type:complete len:116 (+) Transcript_70005:76-423(+)
MAGAAASSAGRNVIGLAPELLDVECGAVAAVRSNGLALQNAPVGLRSTREVVLEAVRENGMALQYASHALRADPEIVEAACNQNPEAFAHLTGDPFALLNHLVRRRMGCDGPLEE